MLSAASEIARFRGQIRYVIAFSPAKWRQPLLRSRLLDHVDQVVALERCTVEDTAAILVLDSVPGLGLAAGGQGGHDSANGRRAGWACGSGLLLLGRRGLLLCRG
jgi:hypothetical protein